MRTYLKYPKKEKQRKPKQRTRDWCPGGGKVLEVFSVTRYHNKEWLEEILRKVEHIRCSSCGRKLEIFNDDSEMMDCDLVRRIPKHKFY
jgi:hypothetical protein